MRRVLEYEGLLGNGVLHAVFSPRKGRFAKPFVVVPNGGGEVVLKYRLLPGRYVVVHVDAGSTELPEGTSVLVELTGMRVLSDAVMQDSGSVRVLYDTGVRQVFLRHAVVSATRKYYGRDDVFRWLCRRIDSSAWQWLVDLLFDNAGNNVSLILALSD